MGIPEHWNVKKSKKDNGVRFIDPADHNNSVRVMPGDPKSKFKNTQGPYVKEVRDGSLIDKNGGKIPSNGRNQNKSTESHIPVNDYNYRPK